jgi:nitrogen fixation protein FixH
MRSHERVRAERTVPSKFGSAPARQLTGRMVLISLLGFVAVVVGANGVMVGLAIGTMPGLESAKPYQAGIGYNAEIETARAQAARHWTVASHIGHDTSRRASIKVEPREADGAPISGLSVTVRLMRPTDQRADRAVLLQERNRGTYLAEIADVAPGAWDIEIEAERGSERLFRSRNRVTLEQR